MSIFFSRFSPRIKVLSSLHKNLFVSSRLCTSKSAVETKTQEVPPPGHYMDLLRKTHRPNNLERKILVWTGRFKNDGEIPPEIPQDTMEKARNKARIKIANYMMAATVLACLGMVISGKKAAERGETIAKMNIDWHKEMNKESK
ncbi:UPF0389 protein CG9231 [Halyomorpha halys]|uniref:UPF0389 protein CG9231 n=1 Tax=Halyomorpha halys TaxID=286706 RepID=UPI0006D4DB10|nr:UPF0389 protein CG9231 [Halyomorpha halys]